MSQQPKKLDKILKHIELHKRASPEEQKLKKRAAKERRASRGKRKRDRIDLSDPDALEEFDPFEKLSRGADDSLDRWVERIRAAETADAPDSGVDMEQGTVVTIGAGWCRVEHGDELVDCDLATSIQEVQQTALAVGDHVLFDPECEPNPRVERVLPRESVLSRPDPGNPNIERAIVANVDLVVVVASVKTPPLHPRLFDRYLIAAWRGGAPVLLVVNKIDLCTPDEVREVEETLEPFRRLGVDVLLCSAEARVGIDELEDELAGKLCAFVGHSGVGKSSVLNALSPGLSVDTGDVRHTDGKGRHTTTSSMMYELQRGIRLVDTPGIRGFAFSKLTLEELVLGFPDLEQHARSCRFRDCSHIAEPDCAVRAAVESGAIDAGRYGGWCRLHANLEQ